MIMVAIRRRFRTLRFSFALVAAVPALLLAQAVSARLEGVVQDPSKGVIPGVEVVATHETTGISHRALSDEAGRYLFANVPPGPYKVTAELRGFKKVVRTGIQLQIGDARTLDLALETGEISETVTVSGEGSLVNTTTTRMGSVVSDRQAQDLPLNGRNPMMLVYLQAGTSPFDRVYPTQQQVGVVDGLDPHTSAIKVEGIQARDPSFDISIAYPSTPVPQEAVGEYRVTTSGDLSDAGRGSGAQVKVLIKSGTNQFHGSLFEFNRNTDYNANNFFNNKSGIGRPVLRRNEFGFALGGPVIPNRTFFFTTAEWQRQTQDVIQNAALYTSTLRNGIFRYYTRGPNSGALVDANGNPTVPAADIGTINLTTVDPTRLGFDTFFLPKVLAVMPQPNNYDVGDGFNTAGYRYNSPVRDDSNQWLVKVDHELSQRHHLAVSYSDFFRNNPVPQQVNGVSPETFEETRRGLSVRLQSTFTANLTNELSVGGNVRMGNRTIVNPGNPDQNTPRGNIFITGLSAQANITYGGGRIRNPAVNLGFSDTATWITGSHTLSFGGEYWFETVNRTLANNDWPAIRTTNANNPANIPALPGLNSTDRALAAQLTNDLTGTIGIITQAFNLSAKGATFVPFSSLYEQLRKREYSLFVQDIWKVRNRLTLNLGLRWNVLPPAYIANGAYGYPVGGVDGALGVQGPTGKSTQWDFAPNGGRDVFRTEWNNFGPSVGLAWDPRGDGKTAVRSSYRVSFDRSFMAAADFSGANYGTTSQIQIQPFTRLSDPRLHNGILPIIPPTVFAPLGNVRQNRAFVADPNLAAPYVQEWSFGVERQIAGSWKVEAAYVGNHAVGMWRGADVNQIEIRKNGFLDAFKIAQSNLATSGSLITGQSLGTLEALFRLVPASQNTLITQGQVAALANFLDTTTLTTGTIGGLLPLAGLPATFFRFNPQVANLVVLGNRAHSTWDGLKLGLSRRFEKGTALQANYTFSKGFTDSIPNQAIVVEAYRDTANMKLDKGLSPLDATHVVLVNGIWELPFGRGKRFLANTNAWAEGFLGGWQLNGIYNWTTGRPLVMTTGRQNLNQLTPSTPNFSGDFTNLGEVYKGNLITFITTQQLAAFTNPGAGELGGLPLSAFHGPGFSTLDMSLFKKFPIRLGKETVSLQFRAEFFNLLNQVSFSNPILASAARLTSTSINAGNFGTLTSAYPARIGQFALKIVF